MAVLKSKLEDEQAVRLKLRAENDELVKRRFGQLIAELPGQGSASSGSQPKAGGQPKAKKK